jgi:hypothetical protein
MTQFYYTYAYLREDRTPYYIGKGQGNRAYKKGKGEVKLPKDKSRIIFLKQNLTEEESFKHEKYMIAVFGRKDNGTGILRNMTDGGDGPSGLIFTEEHRKKLSVSKTPEQRSDAARKGHANKTPEQRSEVARKRERNMTTEQQEARVKNRIASMTPEQRSEAARKSYLNANKTPEQRSEFGKNAAKKRLKNTTPEQRSEISRKGIMKRTAEQRSEFSRIGSIISNAIKFQCTVTGFISNAGPLSNYQRARGIDTSNRVRLS